MANRMHLPPILLSLGVYSEGNCWCYSIQGQFGQFCASNYVVAIWRKDSFLFQHDPEHRAKSMETWFGQFGVEELMWPAESPDLNPNEDLLDELERQL